MDHRTSIVTRTLVIITTTAVGVVLLLSTAGQATGTVAPTVTHRVHPGESLWSIAREYGPEDRDVREVVATIRRLNHLDGSVLQIGQTLDIPVSAAEG